MIELSSSFREHTTKLPCDDEPGRLAPPQVRWAGLFVRPTLSPRGLIFNAFDDERRPHRILGLKCSTGGKPPSFR